MYKYVYIMGVVLMCMCYTPHARAQTKPGNTTYDVELWLKADAAQETLPENNSFLFSWLDRSGSGYDFVRNGTDSVPYFSYSGMNYHPAADFRFVGTYATGNRGRKLVSSQDFPVSADKSYYLFFVSELNADNSSANAAVFSFSNGYGAANINHNGWRNISTSAIYHSVRSSVITPTGLPGGTKYGIVSVIEPNETYGVTPVFYLNGQQGATIYARGMPTISSKAIIGNSNLTTSDSFFGKISEIIVLSSPTAGNLMSDVELRKIHSYLAIKYGITLVNTEVDLYNSGGDKIWDGAASGVNAGFLKNVFGVARDDASGLYQKQAVSYTDKRVSVYVGDQKAALNVQNTGSLADGTYLLFGSNGKTGLVSYADGEETFFGGATMDNPSNVRTTLELKAKVFPAGTPVTLNVALETGGIDYTYLLVSSSSDFSPQSTRIYPVQDGVAANVEIGDNDYLTWVANGGNGPGGVVEELKMWLNADNYDSMTINAGGEVTQWVDPVRNVEYEYMAPSPNRAPTYSEISERMNYHPAVAFAAGTGTPPTWGSYLSTQKGPMSVATPEYHTLITVINNSFTNADRTYFMSFRATTPGDYGRPDYGVIRNVAGRGAGRYRHPEEINGTSYLFNAGATTIAFYEAKSSKGAINPGYIRFEFDGNGESRNYATVDSWYMTRPGTLGSGGYFRHMDGVMSEVFLYERTLTPDEKEKIYSYLALKYGITLRISDNANYPNQRYNYLFSSGEAVWGGESDALHGKYHNNVAGIIRDDAAELNNKQARSTDTGAIIRMGIGRKMGTSPDLDGFENDREAIVWGNNGATGTDPVYESDDICAEVSSRLKRVWMVDKTTKKDYNVLISASGANNEDMYGASYDVYMLVAGSEADISNNSIREVIPGQIVDGEWHFNYTFKNDLTFFTFGGVEREGICNDCDFEGFRTISFDRTTWTAGSRNGTFNLSGVSASVEVSGGTLNIGYPITTTYGSLVLSRRGSANDKITTKITLDTPVIPTFEIFDIDANSNLYDQVRVYGVCSGVTIAAKLSYATSTSSSVYKIDHNEAGASTPISLAYTDLRARMNATFNYPVTEIYVEYTLKGGSSGTQSIGIGAINIECPLSDPVISGDGLSFAKIASSYSVSVCDELTYTFRIRNINCDPKKVKFSDVLPDDMFWIPGSLALDELNDSDPDIQISKYGGSQSLEIDSLTVSGGSVLVFRAKAAFAETAEAQNYENRAFIYFVGINDEDTEWPSTDIRMLEDMTIITASGGPDDRKVPVKVTYSRSKNNYDKGDEIKIVLTVNNPNDEISSVRMDVGYNAGFTCLESDFESSITSPAPLFDSQALLFSIDDFTLPAGESTFEFTLEAPSTLIVQVDENGTEIVDSNGDPVIMPLEVEYSFTTSSGDMCEVASLLDANGKVTVPYNTGIEIIDAIISNKHITGKIIK